MMITFELLKKYQDGKCSGHEIAAVEKWYTSFENEPVVFNDIMSAAAAGWMERSREDFAKLINKCIANPDMQSEDAARDIVTYKSRPHHLSRLAVGIAALLITMIGCAFFFEHSASKRFPDNTGLKRDPEKPVMPGTSNAVLTLADGREINLDSASNGMLTMQGNSSVIKLQNGSLIYSKTATQANPLKEELTYNTLATPRAAQYQLTLPDGSKVWLNAASSIKYPTMFLKNERVVEITGEVYFEIAKQLKNTGDRLSPHHAVPFKVKVDEATVEVLGTHFNVNAYHDRKSVNTTLLEGCVQVTTGTKTVKIVAGQEAILNESKDLLVGEADAESAIAWKNGLFQFNNATITTVMQQVARWYDLDVTYERNVSNEVFKGKIYRSTSIDQLLKILELSGAHFKIDGKKVIVR